ncbi:MAG TPA: metallophosphoesterase, partial [Steroidobacteraceae bacterium]|nr:metallophosphoesterase [Steroidobacteraceae bacterium]
MNKSLPMVFFLAVILGGPARAAATFSVPDSELPEPLVLIAYGDIRFTQAGETSASSPAARRALVAKIAAENPAAVFINGDLPFHGIDADYQVFRAETKIWRDDQIRVYPALGNHELAACLASICLDRWWKTFPQLRGRRWYSVALGHKVLGIALDSAAPLLPGSEQLTWLQSQLVSLDPTVRVVLIVVHHPPVADVQTVKLVDHNARPNEQALAAYLKTAAAHSAARFIVSAGHIHNYERLSQDGVTYLVSGGGGATPYDVDRTPADLYRNTDFPNYHYVRFELRGQLLSGAMIRLEDYAAALPARWKTEDRFEITL